MLEKNFSSGKITLGVQRKLDESLRTGLVVTWSNWLFHRMLLLIFICMGSSFKEGKIHLQHSNQTIRTLL